MEYFVNEISRDWMQSFDLQHLNQTKPPSIFNKIVKGAIWWTKLNTHFLSISLKIQFWAIDQD